LAESNRFTTGKSTLTPILARQLATLGFSSRGESRDETLDSTECCTEP
jgi:hypothetical protein